jgi:hypothetical protein
VLLKLAKALAFLSLTACKMMPGTIRSGTSNAKVGELMDPASIEFTRSADGSTGLLSFVMKDQHECRVEYWAEDPTGTPPPSSPLTTDCSKTELTLQPKVNIQGLTPGMAVTFKIYVWPRTLNFLSNYSVIFKENRDLNAVPSKSLVIVRYAVPRSSDEIYTYQSSGNMSLASIKSSLARTVATPCEENPKDEELPFPRLKSQEDSSKRPLHGLTAVTSSGFGNAQATTHPFFPTRLLQFFDATNTQEIWKWSFQWEGKAFSFDSKAPGSIGSLVMGSAAVTLKNRNLNNVLPEVLVDAKSPVFTPKALLPTDLARYVLTVKSDDGSQNLLRCQFPIDQENVQIPDALYAKLGEGRYVLSFTLETSQIHYREQGDYPPWIITAQDFVHFKLNKRL